METDHNSPDTAAGFDAVHAPRPVVGDRGASWIVEGWDLFRKSVIGWLPLALVGVVWLLLVDNFAFLKYVDNLFAFVISAGVLMACQANFRGEPLKLAFLLAGFHQHLGRLIGARLVLIGLSLLIICVGLGDVAWKIMQSEHLQSLLRKTSVQTDYTSQEFMNNVVELDEVFGLGSLFLRFAVIVLLVIPVTAAGWFVPALIMLGNCDVKTALLLSLKATFTNVIPFLINGLLLLIMALLALLPYFVGYLLLMPLFYLSMYLSYRDLFVDLPPPDSL